MYRLVSWVLLLTLVMVGSAQAASNKTLITIDGFKYTTQDFRDWWGIWQDPGMVFPDTSQGFIDYLLLVEEGRRMEIDLTPEYQRTLHVFLTVRGLAFLKNEEVDSKINVTEKQIREFFADKYAPLWTMQILSYDDLVKAQAAVDDLRVLDGQKAGQLAFADLAGIKAEEGGPLFYEEVSINPSIIKLSKTENWLPVITNLQQWFVSEPLFLEDQDRYVVIRMIEINEDPGEEALEGKRALIKKTLTKRAARSLTQGLVERLRKEQHVKVDEELLAKVNLQDEYSEEFLKKPVVKIDGEDFAVGILIRIMKTQSQLRMGLPEEQLKKMMLETIISETVTNNAALNSHYEDRPPLKVVYDFYTDNTLRKSVESNIRGGVKVSTEDVESYYEQNQSLYSEPAKISYVALKANVDLLDRIDTALSQGADFFDQARAYSLDAKVKTVGVDTLRPALQVELAKLKKGEVSSPFEELEGESTILRVVSRAEGKPRPLEQVQGTIKRLLTKEKFAAAKADYLGKLRSRSKIVVKQGVWKKLKKEYVK